MTIGAAHLKPSAGCFMPKVMLSQIVKRRVAEQRREARRKAAGRRLQVFGSAIPKIKDQVIITGIRTRHQVTVQNTVNFRVQRDVPKLDKPAPTFGNLRAQNFANEVHLADPKAVCLSQAHASAEDDLEQRREVIIPIKRALPVRSLGARQRT